MLSDSIILPLDLERAGPAAAPGGSRSECVFWSRLDGELCAQYFSPAGDTYYQPHSHSEYNVVVCLAGAVAVRQLGGETRIGPGGVLMGNFGVEHSSAYLARGGRCEAVSLTVSPGKLASVMAEFGLPLPPPGSHAVFQGGLESRELHEAGLSLKRELVFRGKGHKIVIESLTRQMLVQALREWPVSRILQCPVDTTLRLSRRDFVRAYEFMRGCRKDAFRLGRVSALVGSSEKRFARLFAAATGSTPVAFYNRLLLDRARAMILDSSCSVKEAGYELGFKTSSQFVAAFRLRFGMAPMEYRCRQLTASGANDTGL